MDAQLMLGGFLVDESMLSGRSVDAQVMLGGGMLSGHSSAGAN